jgi:hypothetical protein
MEVSEMMPEGPLVFSFGPLPRVREGWYGHCHKHVDGNQQSDQIYRKVPMSNHGEEEEVQVNRWMVLIVGVPPTLQSRSPE